MKRWFLSAFVITLTFLAAPELQAQNSYNRWTADPPAPITSRTKHRQADTVALEVPEVKQSKLIKRGLTQRMREHQPLEEDNVSVIFFAQNSHYPEEAVKGGAQGNVIIRLDVAPDGIVSKTSVVSVEPRPVPGWNKAVPPAAMQALANEAQRVFKMLRFEPAKKTTSEELSASFTWQ